MKLPILFLLTVSAFAWGQQPQPPYRAGVIDLPDQSQSPADSTSARGFGYSPSAQDLKPRKPAEKHAMQWRCSRASVEVCRYYDVVTFKVKEKVTQAEDDPDIWAVGEDEYFGLDAAELAVESDDSEAESLGFIIGEEKCVQ